MKQLLPFLFLSLAVSAQSSAQPNAKHAQPASPASYFPPRGEWQHRSPSALGLDSSALQDAIRYAREMESKAPRDQELAQAESFGKAEPFDEGIGPFKERGEPTGIIIYKGYIVAEWGEPSRIDMTHSVTKSFLSTVIGVAVDQGLIHSVEDTVAPYIPPIEVYNPANIERTPEDLGKPQLLYPFTSPHNRLLTWDVMLRQTSDWEGTLWGKPDWQTGRMADPAAKCSRLRLEIQRCPGERIGPGRYQCLASAPSPGTENIYHGPHRRLQHLAMERLP
jgi:hypothetical protein